MRLIISTFCVTGFIAWLSLLPRDQSHSLAAEVQGNAGCWELQVSPCLDNSYDCGSIPCAVDAMGNQVCPSGQYEQTAYPGIIVCGQAETGYESCGVGEHPLDQFCVTRRSCGTSCVMAVSGPAAGSYFCSGPVGPVWIVTIYPTPTLKGNACRPPDFS